MGDTLLTTIPRHKFARQSCLSEGKPKPDKVSLSVHWSSKGTQNEFVKLLRFESANMRNLMHSLEGWRRSGRVIVNLCDVWKEYMKRHRGISTLKKRMLWVAGSLLQWGIFFVNRYLPAAWAKVHGGKLFRAVRAIQRVVDPWKEIHIFFRYPVKMSLVDTKLPSPITLVEACRLICMGCCQLGHECHNKNADDAEQMVLAEWYQFFFSLYRPFQPAADQRRDCAEDLRLWHGMWRPDADDQQQRQCCLDGTWSLWEWVIRWSHWLLVDLRLRSLGVLQQYIVQSNLDITN